MGGVAMTAYKYPMVLDDRLTEDELNRCSRFGDDVVAVFLMSSMFHRATTLAHL
jgi:hypothetical protein